MTAPREHLPFLYYFSEQLGGAAELTQQVYNFREVVTLRISDFEVIISHLIPFIEARRNCLYRMRREYEAFKLSASLLLQGAGSKSSG